jgi:hypothetical protein
MVNDKTNRKGKKMTKLDFIPMSDDFQGTIPSGYDLVAVEISDVDNETFESAMVLNGFDEIDYLDFLGFNNGVVGFLSN